MREIKGIILHCDANDNPFWGLKELRFLHESKGFKGIGYHYWIDFEGKVHPTRYESIQGCHTFGKNKFTLAICLHGKNNFTEKQFQSLKLELVRLCKKYKLTQKDIYPHNQFAKKLCPNFSLDNVKKYVEEEIKGEEQDD